MFRPSAARRVAAIFCLLGASCQAITGDVDVIPATSSGSPVPGAQTSEGDATMESPAGPAPALPVNGVAEAPAVDAPLDEGLPPTGDGASAPPDSTNEGTGEVEEDGGLPPLVARPVLAQGTALELERVGEVGGEPHLGVCEGGVVIGIRPTANPSEEVFGQRVTLVEPLCGTLLLEPGTPGEAARVRVVPDEEILSWPVTDELQGPPATDVPDPRLVWVVQPPTSCPQSAPVLVGLAGEYDPSAPDSSGTAAIRSVVIECAPLVVDGIEVSAAALGRQLITRGDTFAAQGSADYASSCPDGAVTTQILLHAGFWLDGFVLGCSSLKSPRLAGEPCSGAADCQTGVCGSDALCGP